MDEVVCIVLSIGWVVSEPHIVAIVSNGATVMGAFIE